MQQSILLAVASIFVSLLFHQTDAKLRDRTRVFYVNNKVKTTVLESKPEYQAEFQVEAEDATDFRGLRNKNHPRGKTFSSIDIVHWEAKSQTSSNNEPIIFQDIKDYQVIKQDEKQMNSNKMIKYYQQRTNGRSSRQRRTVQTSEKTLVCQEELSCRNKCQNPRRVLYETKLSCFCDEDCEFFEDCCADYDDFCSTKEQNVTSSTTQNTSSAENLVTQENRDLWRCYEGEELKGTFGIWMIGSCPSSWSEDDVLNRCRNLSNDNTITRDSYRYLPVYTSNGRVYHNRFCAQCNGVSPKDSREFSLSFECDFTPPHLLSLNYTISYLFSYCRLDIKKQKYWLPRKGDPRRYCLTIVPQTRCLSSINNDINMTFHKCLIGKPRIVTSDYFYANTDCAKCMNHMSHVSCGPNIAASKWKVINYVRLPFSINFDFNNDNSKGLDLMQIQARCPSDKVFDHYLDLCTDTIPAFPSLSDFYQYQVVLWMNDFYSDIKENDSPMPEQERILRALAVPIQQVKSMHLTFRNFYYFMFTLQIQKNESLQENIRKILNFTLPFNIWFRSRILYTIVKANKRVISCANRQKYYRSEYTVLKDGSSAVSIKKTGEVFQSTDYYINASKTSTSANDSQAIFVCHQHQISNCSGVYILINEGEFRVLLNKSIFVNASKQVYDWSEYIWQDNRVMVCENFSTTYYKSKLVSNNDPVLTTLTIVCMSLSIIGLVFVLVTYSLFSELRTPPGINLMNLSVSILLAQLLWLLGSGLTDRIIPCFSTLIAVVLHYLFLVSFVWTSIIAFDTWRALSAEHLAFANDDIQIAVNEAVGWLPGLVYMFICVTLDFTDTVNIGYKSRITCWMANEWVSACFFAVPVFMPLVFNLVIYVLTFRAIKVTTAQARETLDKDTKKTFGIYVRIASLMGFTWIFGFAAPFGWQFLWYPFVILNGLQGVYIALAFALNKRARVLYRCLLQSLKSQPQQSISLSTISRTNAEDSIQNNESFDISV